MDFRTQVQSAVTNSEAQKIKRPEDLGRFLFNRSASAFRDNKPGDRVASRGSPGERLPTFVDGEASHGRNRRNSGWIREGNRDFALEASGNVQVSRMALEIFLDFFECRFGRCCAKRHGYFDSVRALNADEVVTYSHRLSPSVIPLYISVAQHPRVTNKKSVPKHRSAYCRDLARGYFICGQASLGGPSCRCGWGPLLGCAGSLCCRARSWSWQPLLQ